MKHTALFALLLAAVFLSACGNSDAPSDKEATDIIYGIYLKEATIANKTKCEVTPEMEVEGATNVWLIEYRFEGSVKTYSKTIMEQDGDWVVHGALPFCPGDPPVK
jgi:hypothetical protein